MIQYISLLRGINVGGHRKIKMAELKELYKELGFDDTISYIQSGNLIFKTDSHDIQALESKIEAAIKSRFTFDVPVIIRRATDWKQIMMDNPFLKDNQYEEHLLISFFSGTPRKELVQALKERQTDTDQFRVLGDTAYLLVKGPYHKTPLNNQFFEKTLQLKSTTRNWKTIQKLSSLID